MKKKQEKSDLETLQHEGETIMVKGDPVTVKPFTFGQLLKALKYLANLGTSISLDRMDDTAMIQALALHTDDVLSLLMLSTGKDRDFFDELDPELGIDIAMAAWRVNQDFFAQKLAPKIQKMQELSNSADRNQTPANSEEPEKAGSASSKT